MAELLSPAILKGISDKTYEKRKSSALEIESIVKRLAASGDQERIWRLTEKICTDYAYSSQPNARKGALLCLAAAVVGIGQPAEAHLRQIVPPVMHSFSDQDARVRYYACESLYNIAKCSGPTFIVFFSEVFEAMLKLVADNDQTVVNAVSFLDNIVKDNVTASPSKLQLDVLIPKLKEFLRVVHPMKRSFLISWISFLDSIPDLDILVHLPSLLDGLFNYISDPSKEIRAAASSALGEFLLEIHATRGNLDVVFISKILTEKSFSSDDTTRLTAFKWMTTFVQLFASGLIDQMPTILASVLANASHPKVEVRAAALEADSALLGCDPPKGKKDDVWKKVSIPSLLSSILPEANSHEEPSRLLAWKWILFLLSKSQEQVLSSSPSLIPSLLDSIGDGSEALVSQGLEVISALAASNSLQFRQVLSLLLDRFRGGEAGVSLLQRVGALTIRRLVKRLGGEQVLSELSIILDGEQNLHFASMFVQALNLLLLTSPELSSVRQTLKNPGSVLFDSLFPAWSHSCGAALSLCFLSAKFSIARDLIHSFADLNVGAEVLLQMDRLVSLLETPAFTFLRLQLLRPRSHPDLLQALLSLLALLPQSNSWRTLNTRISSIPIQALLLLDNAAPHEALIRDVSDAAHLDLFRARQKRHELLGDSKSLPDDAILRVLMEAESTAKKSLLRSPGGAEGEQRA